MKRKHLVRATQFDDPIYADLARQMLAADDKVQVKRKDTGRLVWVTKEKANDPQYEKPDGKSDKKDEKAPPEVVKKKEKWEKGEKPKLTDLEKRLEKFMGNKPSQSDVNAIHHLGKKPPDEWDENDWDVAQHYPGYTQKDFAWLAKKSEEQLKNLEEIKKDTQESKRQLTDEGSKDKGEKEEKSDAGDTKKPKKKDLSPKDLAKLKKFREDAMANAKAKKRLEEYKADVEKGKKPKSDKTDAQLMREFKQEVSAEMKERMEGMSPKEFMEMMAAISDEEDEMGKAATLRKDLLRAALGSTNPAFKRRVAHILMAADDKVQVRRKDTGRLVWVTKEKANDPDYEMTEEKGDAKEAPKKDNLKKDKDAPKAERLKGKPGEKAEGKGDSSEKDPDKKDKSKTPKRPDSMAGLDLLEGHDSKEFSALMSDMTATPEETQEVIDDLESALKYDMEDDEEEEIRQIKRTIKELKRYQDEYKEQKGKKAMTLRKDLIRLASTMKPSPERSALIQVLASHNKSAHFPYLDRRSGNLSREGIRGDGLSKSVMRGGDGFALYYVDAAKNHSKFYEGMLHEQPNGLYDVKFRWGAMTDSGYTGRVDGRKYDEKFSNLTYSEAKRALDKKKRAKVGKGYVDTFGPKHKDPVTGKKLKQGEYPIGLAREVGFGWGTQTMAYCVPALREIAEHISRALDPNDGTTAEADLSRAQRLVSNVPDSQMAGKINRYIAVVMREVNRGSDQAVINKKLRTLQNYIQKQVALCG